VRGLKVVRYRALLPGLGLHIHRVAAYQAAKGFWDGQPTNVLIIARIFEYRAGV
jgi:hypothetical protein